METSKITNTLFDFKKPLPESSSSVSIVKIKSTNRGQFVYTKKSDNLNKIIKIAHAEANNWQFQYSGKCYIEK